MAVISQILKKESVRKGYDIKVLYTDNETDKRYLKVFYFPSESEPSDNDLTDRIAHIKGNVEDLIADESFREAHPPIDREQTEKILKEKGLIASDEYIEDLKYKENVLNEVIK